MAPDISAEAAAENKRIWDQIEAEEEAAGTEKPKTEIEGQNSTKNLRKIDARIWGRYEM